MFSDGFGWGVGFGEIDGFSEGCRLQELWGGSQTLDFSAVFDFHNFQKNTVGAHSSPKKWMLLSPGLRPGLFQLSRTVRGFGFRETS
jgi:hypothetical protein